MATKAQSSRHRTGVRNAQAPTQDSLLVGRQRIRRTRGPICNMVINREVMHQGVHKAMDNLRLQPVANCHERLPRLRGRAIEPNSLRAYEKHYRGLNARLIIFSFFKLFLCRSRELSSNDWGLQVLDYSPTVCSTTFSGDECELPGTVRRF